MLAIHQAEIQIGVLFKDFGVCLKMLLDFRLRHAAGPQNGLFVAKMRIDLAAQAGQHIDKTLRSRLLRTLQQPVQMRQQGMMLTIKGG